MLSDNKFLRGVILGLLIYATVVTVEFCRIGEIIQELHDETENTVNEIDKIDSALIIKSKNNKNESD